MMKITYIGHSGFLVELEEVYLLFDYEKGVIPALDKEKELYVFVSHAHGDHYNSAIFTLRETYYKLQYIISDDVVVENKFAAGFDDIFHIGEDENKLIGMCQVHTLISTDFGVAFLVTVGGQTIYHAGDLNWWHWSGESEAYNAMMCVNYKKEINLIQGAQIDLAFLPVDPRLGEAYLWGLNYFMEKTDTKWVVPMHFWKKYAVLEKIKEDIACESTRDKIIRMREGESRTL
ncbi:MAG: MBL fold metallo-hydrolase [Lachnospiraceae bacterium]|nr:MBL fold metallo-hydrolase [Lachnospiraceae bacterium]